MDRPEIISKLSFYLIDKEPLLYLFIINSDFVKDEQGFLGEEGKAGVLYKNNRVQFYYTDTFLKLPLEELYFILIHEAYHIFKHHLTIHSELSNFHLRNIAEDAIINDEIMRTKFLGISPKMPGGRARGIEIPENFKNDYYKLKEDAFTTPRLYNWYLKNESKDKKDFLLKNKYCKNQNGDYGKVIYEDCGDLIYDKFEDKKAMFDDFEQGYTSRKKGIRTESPENLTPVIMRGGEYSFEEGFDQEFECEINGYFDDKLDSEQVSNDDDDEENIIPQRVFTENLVKQSIEMTEQNKSLQAAKKAAGINEGNSLMGSVNKLLKSEVNWKKEFKQGLNVYMSDRGSIKGTKDSYITYLMNPRSRYGIIAKHKLKTNTKKQNYVIIAIDTSGSCFYDDYDKERFFTEIDNIAKEMEFSQSGKVYALMWDWYVSDNELKEYKVGDWKNFKLEGGGGTNPQNVFRFLKDQTEIKGNSAIMRLNKKVSIHIPNTKEMPFLLFLTDGYFYNRIVDDDLWLWKKDKKSLMFMTRTESNLPNNIKRIIYK